MKIRPNTLFKILTPWLVGFAAGFNEIAAQSLEITRVGQWSGPLLGEVLGIAVSGKYAYLANGLQVFDISNATNPVQVGGGSSGGYSLALSGTYAFVVDYFGLDVIDLTSPTNPVPVGQTNVSDAQAVAVSGNYAYVAAGTRLEVIDVSCPANPVVAGRTNTSGSALSVAVSGNYAYMGAGFSLQIFNVSNAANPVRVGSTNVSGSPHGVAVSGNYAYVAAGLALQVVDVSNPASPVLVGTAPTGGVGYGVAVAGNYAYVAADSAGLKVVDISNPASPVVVGAVPGTVHTVAVSGNYAYVGGYGGIRVINISNPANPVQVGSFGTGDSSLGVALSGTYAYLADNSSGLEVIDASNLASPTRVGGYYGNVYAQDVTVSGNYAYAVASYGIQTFDISNRTHPSLVGSYYFAEPVGAVALSGNYAYVGHSSGLTARMEILDVSNPANPISLGIYSVPTNNYPWGATQNSVRDIAVSGSYAYLGYGGSYYWLACGDYYGTFSFGGIEVVDVSNPANPVRKGSYPSGGGYSSGNQYIRLMLFGNYVYAAYGRSDSCPPSAGGYAYTEGGLNVFSISNSTNLVYVGGYHTNAYPSDAAVSSNHVYLSGSSPKFQVIDISNKTNPVFVAGYNTPGSALGVKASGSYAFVADGAQGLQILWIGAPQPVLLSAERSANQLRLGWPVSASGYALESTASLSMPQWQSVPGTPQLTNDFYQLLLPATNPAAFFRLRGQ